MKIALNPEHFPGPSKKKNVEIKECLRVRLEKLEAAEDQKNREIKVVPAAMKCRGVEMVKVYVATKRNLSVGDKKPPRHATRA